MIFFYFFVFLALTLWLGILLSPDGAYRYREIFAPEREKLGENPPFVSVLIPARNEEKILPETLPSLLTQPYPKLEVLLIDDHSTDDTARVAKSLGESCHADFFQVVSGKSLEPGWAGKLWALHQGLEHAKGNWILFTDADLHYAQSLLPSLLAFALREKVAMVSLMAKLRTQTFWEKLLIPAFLYFFKLMYPFSAVKKDNRKVAAAAGGCILIKRSVLTEIGGLERIRGALIDDISLAKAVKGQGHKIVLMDSPELVSKRGYDDLRTLWHMVVRSAFTELKYSYLRLLGCVLMMVTLFALPLIACLMPCSCLSSLGKWACIAGALSWLTMAFTYFPSVRYFGLNGLWAITLPLSAILYLTMTLDSARRYLGGTRSFWKGREYK